MSIILEAEIREKVGTSEAKALRKKGSIPATVYGNQKQEMSIAIREKEITALYKQDPSFTTKLIELKLGGKAHKVLVKKIELHPVTELAIHVDFMHLGEKTHTVSVPIAFEGKEKSLGVRRGGFFNMIKRRLNVTCPSNKIPFNLSINVANMQVGESIKVKQIPLPENCQFVENLDAIVASITGRGGKAKEGEENSGE